MSVTAAEGHTIRKILPPFRALIEGERPPWAPLKRALSQEDRALFDRLFDCAKQQVQAGVMVSRPWALETMVMPVLLEQRKMVEETVKMLEEFMPGKE